MYFAHPFVLFASPILKKNQTNKQKQKKNKNKTKTRQKQKKKKTKQNKTKQNKQTSKKRIYQVWFLFGMRPGVDSYSRHF